MMEQKMRTGSLLFIVCCLLTLPGCMSTWSDKDYFLRDDVDMSFISRIAVLDFDDNDQGDDVAEQVRDLVTTQILARGLFDVIDKGLVKGVVIEESPARGRSYVDAASIKRIGQRLDVQALLLGTLDYSGDGRKGASTFPELSMTLRLIDANSGMIFWQASGRASGDSLWRRILGVSAEDRYRVAMRLIGNLLSTIPGQGQ